MDTLWIYPALFGTGCLAGFVDAIAGGGGLITLPVLLSLGLDPREALGTNKLQALFGSGSATFRFAREGYIDFRNSKSGIFFTAIGATLGTLLVGTIPPDLLRQIIPWMLAIIALYVLAKPNLGTQPAQPRMGRGSFQLLFGLLLGFYDGFLGPGTGTFWAMAYVLALGMSLTSATAHTKLMNFTSNIASLVVFLLHGAVLFLPGLVMGLGQVCGAQLGAHFAVRKGAALIRPVFIMIVLAIIARLLLQNFS